MTEDLMVSIVMAGGGTAGHTSPLIATAQRLAELAPEASISSIGTPKGLENRVIPAAGLELDLVPPVPLPRRPSLDLVKLPVNVVKAVRQAKAILTRRGADVVVGFGGYVSLPAYLAAKQLGVPVVVHEQNAVPGLANKVAARFARVVAVTFPDTPLRNAWHVGLPVRREISELDRGSAREDARTRWGFDVDRPLLLVSGGSQGARSINVATTGARDRLLAAGVNVLHVLGPRNMSDEFAESVDADTGARYLPVAYVESMEDAYAAADLMLGRAGAATVMETAIVGLPVVFVPLPHGNGEQAKNAAFLVEGGAGRMIMDEELDADRLVSEVVPLLLDPDAVTTMSDACHGLVSADAAGELARAVLQIVGGG